MAEINPTALSGSSYKSINPLPANNPAQAGPNCGLYALSYVMRHWHDKLLNTTGAIQQPLPARKVDVEGAVKLPRNDPNKGTSLREVAKHVNTTHPLTFLGELFSADSLLTVARRTGFDAKSHVPESKDYVKTLFKLVDANHPAIVSLDVDQDIHTVGPGRAVKGPRNGCPGKFGGEHAHWAVIVAYQKGFFTDDLVMFHWERYFQFGANDLRDSAAQLIRFSGQTWYKPTDPTQQVLRDEHGNAKLFYQVDSNGKPLTLLPPVTKPTDRGKHWVKLDPLSQPRNTNVPGSPAWNGSDPGDYAIRDNTTPLLTTQCTGVVVRTAFNNTNLNLKNVIIEVVPHGTAFA
jgi:hypothetical protein